MDYISTVADSLVRFMLLAGFLYKITRSTSVCFSGRRCFTIFYYALLGILYIISLIVYIADSKANKLTAIRRNTQYLEFFSIPILILF